jgi:hypothetical protein
MEQRRIKVEGWNPSDIHLTIAIIQTCTGQIHFEIEGCEPTIPNLVAIRQLLDQVCKKIDDLLPKFVQDEVKQKLK